MNVALYKRREREATLGVPCLFARLRGEIRFDVGEATVGNAQVNRVLTAREGNVLNEHSEAFLLERGN